MYASVLFLFLMSAFVETLEKEWRSSNLPQSTLKNITNMNRGQLTGHTKENMQRGIKFIIHQILYIDDRAFFFESRENATSCLEMINQVFTKFGLEMHIGRGDQLSKTNIMYISKASFYLPPKESNTIKAPPPKPTPLIASTSPADDTTDDDDAPLITQPKKPLNKIF